MLSNTAVLGVDDVRVSDRVEELGLTVVDVTHDGDDRRTGLHILGVVELFGLEVDVEGLEQLAVLVLGGDDLDVVAELGAQGRRRCPGRGTAWRSPSRPGRRGPSRVLRD